MLEYYQKELGLLKYHAKIFSERFPKISKRLGMLDGETEDPHVNRLMESFAFLTSRIHMRLDEDMPEIVDSLLSSIAPQFVRSLPSVCIVMIHPDEQHSGITKKNEIAAGTRVYTRQSKPLSCQFQTVYPVSLLPLSVRGANLFFHSDELNWRLKLQFQVWSNANISSECIRLYLHGANNVVNTIYTLLCSEIRSIEIWQNGIRTELSADNIKPVGFAVEESLLTRDPRIAPVHILMLDYFWFPKKFSFIDIQLPADFKATGFFEIQAVFERNPLTETLGKFADLIDNDFFRLHCTPAINIFKQRAEPIMLSDSKKEYPIIPDNRNINGIVTWAIQDVFVQRKVGNQIINLKVPPLLESNALSGTQNVSGLFWNTVYRKFVDPEDIEQMHHISFGKAKGNQYPLNKDIVSINLLCSNNLLPYQIQYGNFESDFDSDITIAALRIIALTHPTAPVPALDKDCLRWRILSQLSLNFQLLGGENGVKRLKEMLSLYCFNDNNKEFIICSLIQSIKCTPTTARLKRDDPNSLARGLDIIVTFTNDVLVNPDFYIFCCLLDRLLALYAPVNSFTRLMICVENEEKYCRVWPIRAGKLSWL